MTSSLTVSFSGSSSVLRADFLPEIILDEQYDYFCALLDLIVVNSSEENIIIHGVMRVECDIISESYINGVRKHTIHQFAVGTSLDQGALYSEIPQQLNYFPVKKKNLRSIQISVADLNGVPIQGDIHIRINIRRFTQ